MPFERAEYVRSDQTYSILNRLVRATQVDTIVHTFLVVDSTQVPSRALHEINVIGTMNLLAAAGAPGSPVRHVVVKSSTLVYGSSEKDPNTFAEDTPRSAPPRTAVERSLVEAEALVHDFADDNPDVVVTLLRFANVLGTDIVTPITKNLSRPLCPSIFGFDPLVQFVEEDDVVRAVELRHPQPASRRLQRRRPRSAALERGRVDLRDPAPPPAARPPCPRHRPARPPPCLRAPARARSPPALRPWRRHPPPDRCRLRLPLHQRRRRRELRPSPPPTTKYRPPSRAVHVRARRRAVLPALAVRRPDWGRLSRCMGAVHPRRHSPCSELEGEPSPAVPTGLTERSVTVVTTAGGIDRSVVALAHVR